MGQRPSGPQNNVKLDWMVCFHLTGRCTYFLSFSTSCIRVMCVCSRSFFARVGRLAASIWDIIAAVWLLCHRPPLLLFLFSFTHKHKHAPVHFAPHNVNARIHSERELRPKSYYFDNVVAAGSWPAIRNRSMMR